MDLLENYKVQKKLLVEALVEKDYMELYQSTQLKNDFILKIGEPKYELHKLELIIARNKLKLEMMQTCIHFQIPIDYQHIDRTLEKEFEKHFNMLEIMKKDIESVQNMSEESQDKLKSAEELKGLYLSIAEYVHPDLTIKADKKSIRIWKAAKTAYEKRDVAKLKRLEKKVLEEYHEVPEVQGEPVKIINKAVRTMKSKTKSVLSEIESLKKQFPFNEAQLLQDDDAVEKYKKDIELDIRIARELLDKLEKQILEKLPAPSELLN